VSQTSTGDTGRSGGAASAKKKRGLFGRLALFFRQVVAELRKVVRPTRSELVSYTVVVIVFVSFVMALVASVDFGFTKLVLWVFGG
jgi:preprotein translocase subunit SecE